MSRTTVEAALLLTILSLWCTSSYADPFDRFNKPVSIGWWQASCAEAYVTKPQEGYAKGYCDGVMLAYLNQLEQWCVPDDVTWGEVKSYVALTISEANIEPLSDMNIGDWMEKAMQVKWPCEQEPSNNSYIVTDPALLEELNSKKKKSLDEIN
ncbi:MAG: hypothetical protein JJ956_08715 [Pseudomonadales bacterium]|nr:hypothetical protein [Pseudomonadales bacterium]